MAQNYRPKGTKMSITGNPKNPPEVNTYGKQGGTRPGAGRKPKVVHKGNLVITPNEALVNKNIELLEETIHYINNTPLLDDEGNPRMFSEMAMLLGEWYKVNPRHLIHDRNETAKTSPSRVSYADTKNNTLVNINLPETTSNFLKDINIEESKEGDVEVRNIDLDAKAK